MTAANAGREWTKASNGSPGELPRHQQRLAAGHAGGRIAYQLTAVAFEHLHAFMRRRLPRDSRTVTVSASLYMIGCGSVGWLATV